MRIQRRDDFDGLVSLTMKMRRREQFVLMTGEVQQRWKQKRQAFAHDQVGECGTTSTREKNTHARKTAHATRRRNAPRNTRANNEGEYLRFEVRKDIYKVGELFTRG